MFSNLKSGLVALGLFLMVGVLTLTFAFKANTSDTKLKKAKYATAWYVYQPSTFTMGQVQNPANYIRVSGTPGCSAATNICAVQLTDNGPGSNPIFTAANQTDLWNAQQHLSTPGYIKLKN